MLLEPIAACLIALQGSPAVVAQEAERYELRVAEDSELELRAFWEPCRTSTYGLFEQTPALRAPAPARERDRYDGPLFRTFLPRAPVALGEVWEVAGTEVLEFLRQFHAGAVQQARFSGGEVPGTYACLRAVSARAFEILIRAHASFHLEDGVIYKPGQYEGRLVVERGSGALLWFQLALPSRDTNVDVNVPYEDVEGGRTVKHMSADIGWVPRMELTSGDPPAFEWSRELALDEARLALRRAFYRFAQLDWLPFEEAVLRARQEQKPLHLVLLFGVLDDDSC